METVVKNCKECGKTFSITPEELKFYEEKGLQPPSRCKCCREKKRHTEYIPCKDCEIPFPMTVLEMEWYEKQGWKQPSRCPECRKKRRESKSNP